ncbi:MAG TPA: hypothetical protein VGN17_26935 [Bryobacteraceae bacterium]|jgi:hypothetical protein
MTLYVTFHGGKPTKSIPKPIWYVVSYAPVNDVWQQANANVLGLPAPSGSDAADGYELRDLQLAWDGNFYLVNSYKGASVIWQIPEAGLAPGAAPVVYTSGAAIPGIDHPFGFCFDSAMQVCFISAQDTNVVVAAYGPPHKKSGTALPVNSTVPGSNFLAGTFVASELGIPVPVGSKPVPSNVKGSDGGLHYSPKSGPPLSNSVRGVALIGTTLFAADEVGSEVKTFDVITGDYLGPIKDPNHLIDSPVHLLASEGTLYISTSKAVLSYDPGTATLVTVVPHLTSPAGMAFDAEGNFYVANRTGGSIDGYDYLFQPMAGNPLISGLADNPEFLWCVD